MPNDCGPGMPWNGNSLFALYNANRFVAAYIRLGTMANQKKLFFHLREAKSKISVLDEGDMRSDQVKLIAKRLGVTEHAVIDMNRRLGGDASLNGADPRGRRSRRVAGSAGGRIPGPGNDARRARRVR